jgi:hypothetical protein
VGSNDSFSYGFDIVPDSSPFSHGIVRRLQTKGRVGARQRLDGAARDFQLCSLNVKPRSYAPPKTEQGIGIILMSTSNPAPFEMMRRAVRACGPRFRRGSRFTALVRPGEQSSNMPARSHGKCSSGSSARRVKLMSETQTSSSIPPEEVRNYCDRRPG